MSVSSQMKWSDGKGAEGSMHLVMDKRLVLVTTLDDNVKVFLLGGAVMLACCPLVSIVS